MAVNNLTYEDSHAFLMSLYNQALGDQAVNVSTGDFTTVAQAVLKTGYDNIINSISQVLSRTIFSVRPYSAKFKGIEADAERWGAIVRKINYVDGELEKDDRMSLTDGVSVDPWIVNKPKVVQTNFYGSTEYQRHVTIFRDQLDAAFQSEGQFNSFISGVMENIASQLEMIKESESRGVIINMIAGRAQQEAVNDEKGLYINVLQEYYNETGVNLSPANMFSGTNYAEFVKWFFAYLNTLSSRLSNRSTMYHTNITGKAIPRHTPAEMLKAYIYKPVLDKIDSQVLSTIFNPEYLKAIDFEGVDYWQSLNRGEESTIKATPTYMINDGSLATGTAATYENVLGLIFDRDALGITTESTWMEATPFNPRGGYYNIFWHFRQRTWNDFTENAVVLYAGNVTV